MRAACSAWLVLALGCARPVPPVGIDSTLRRELLAHGATDQAIRDTLVQVLQAGGKLDSSFGGRMAAIDSANTDWLKQVVAAHGWPARSRVGADGAEAAFLIVQHAVQDTDFQARMLPLMEQAVAAGEAKGSDIAMLADRLAVHRGGKQRYGTQAKLVEGRLVMDPIDDSAHVDERRAALGLPPLRVYVAVLESLYTARPHP